MNNNIKDNNLSYKYVYRSHAVSGIVFKLEA